MVNDLFFKMQIHIVFQAANFTILNKTINCNSRIQILLTRINAELFLCFSLEFYFCGLILRPSVLLCDFFIPIWLNQN